MGANEINDIDEPISEWKPYDNLSASLYMGVSIKSEPSNLCQKIKSYPSDHMK